MKEKILLLLSFIFSLILFTFSTDNALEFLDVKISFSLMNVSGISSHENYITTAFIGYVFLLLLSFFLWKKSNDKNLLLILVTLSILGMLFELNSIFKALSDSYTGQHLRIGIALSLLGLFILNESIKSPSKLNN